jgi:3-oxoadipate enol-lactonase
MRLAARWQRSWAVFSPGIEEGDLESVRIGDEWVDVLRLGRGDPLVLVPGLAGSWKLLLPLARRLARYYEVFACGLRGDRFSWGGGDDGRRQAGGIAAYAHDLASLIERLGLECPAVFGVSFGGAIALELAALRPELLSALVVSGAGPRFSATIGSSIARRVLERFPLPSDNRFINQFFHLLYGAKPDPGPLVDFVIDCIWETDQSVMAQRLAALESFDVSGRLWRVDVPVLVLAGARDVIVPPRLQRELADEVSGARFELIENAGHLGFLTHRDLVVRGVRRHLRRKKTAV